MEASPGRGEIQREKETGRRKTQCQSEKGGEDVTQTDGSYEPVVVRSLEK